MLWRRYVACDSTITSNLILQELYYCRSNINGTEFESFYYIHGCV